MKKYSLIILITALFAITSNAKDYKVFDVIGDSISAGVNPEVGLFGWVDMLYGGSSGGYTARTNTIFTLWPGVSNLNSAVSGSKASDWASDWNGNLTAVKSNQPDLLLIYIGGNDLLAYLGDGDFSLAEQGEYRTNLVSIITNVLDNTTVPDIILVTYYDLFDGFSSLLGSPYENYKTMSQATIIGNWLVKDVGDDYNCYLVDGVYESFLHHCYGAELGDISHQAPDYVHTPLTNFDIHPVTAGHDEIYEMVYEKLEYLKNYAVPEQWLAQYGLSNYYADVALDQDNDGHTAFEEYIAGTDPTNSASFFRISENSSSSPNGPVLTWNAISNRYYAVLWATNVVDTFQILQSNITANAYTDTVHIAEEAIFYRINVQE